MNSRADNGVAMDSRREASSVEIQASVSHVSEKTQKVLIATYLGAFLGFLYISRAQTLKPLSITIKLAHGAVKGIKFVHSLQSPTPLALVFASKVLIKGYFLSKRFNVICRTSQKTTMFSSRLKAFVGALNLVRYSRVKHLGSEFLGFGLVQIGYKVSKNFVRVSEGFLGLQFDSAVRKAIDGLGLFVKSVTVTREISKISKIAGRGDYTRNLEVEDDTVLACRFVRKFDPVFSVCLHSKRINGTRSSNEQIFSLDFPCYNQTDSSVDEGLDACLSDLLCLSIPVSSCFL